LLKIDDSIEGHEKIRAKLKHFEGTVHYLKIGDRKIRTMILWEGSPRKEKGVDLCVRCCSEACADKLADKLIEAKAKEIRVELLLPEIGH
jgi:hypothetical protein